MSDLSRGATALIKNLFGGNEKERMISAGVVRTILSDMTRLYFENRAALGNGILVFDPENPEQSKYMTKTDLENDLAVAQEGMDRKAEELFSKVIKVIEKEADSDLALVAMVQRNEIAIHLIDPKEANKKIDEYSNGLFY
jgi:hypothetical protein